jgi:hypothetical protein
MKTATNYAKQIFCIEGDWHPDLRQKDTIESALKFMETASGMKIKYIHRHCSTEQELQNRINEYNKRRYNNFSIFYLAFHGVPNGLKLSPKTILSLEDLGKMAKNKLKNKIVHLGSCETLNINRKDITNFLQTTGALCVSGFKKEVPFVSSTIFDVLYFEMCQYYKQIHIIEKHMKNYYGKMMKELQFVMVYD